ncbi:hypothetical protein [uncultured Arthrobacter sp.]|uniref:hypothetical protein n=1 Tax=uncultured Arthrobacter sp. TaxID=114050 RepID=UPI0028D5DAC2|nr:hypothetical protein [uncultured Arthrobacter sp.]
MAGDEFNYLGAPNPLKSTVGMHQTLQLDWFPDGTVTNQTQMIVDWVRVYR